MADFDDTDSIDAALNGAARAYLLTPSGPNAEAQRKLFAERAAAGVRHVVKLSQLAADEASPVRFLRYHAAVTRRIRELGLAFTFFARTSTSRPAGVLPDDRYLRLVPSGAGLELTPRVDQMLDARLIPDERVDALLELTIGLRHTRVFRTCSAHEPTTNVSTYRFASSVS